MCFICKLLHHTPKKEETWEDPRPPELRITSYPHSYLDYYLREHGLIQFSDNTDTDKLVIKRRYPHSCCRDEPKELKIRWNEPKGNKYCNKCGKKID